MNSVAMNPAEVPAAQRNDERPSGSTSHQVCSIAYIYSSGACELHKLRLVCTLVESKHAAACLCRAKTLIIEQWEHLGTQVTGARVCQHRFTQKTCTIEWATQ